MYKEMVKEIISNQNNTIDRIYLVACGGSLVDMYPAKFFLEKEASKVAVGFYTANEFVQSTPKALDEGTMTILCSHGGMTPETIEAGRVARERGSVTIGLTNHADAKLIDQCDYPIVYNFDFASGAKISQQYPSLTILQIVVEVVNAVEGYAHYDAFMEAYSRIDQIIESATQQVKTRAERYSEIYGKEKMIYILGSGAAFGQAYGASICSLMEMLWINSAVIHSGEYFHGPFEVTDYETPHILFMSEGSTRVLDERVLSFLRQYAKKVEVIDAKELGIGIIDSHVVE